MPNLQIEVNEQIYQHYLATSAEQKQHIQRLLEEILLLISPKSHPAWTEQYKNEVIGAWQGDLQRPADTTPELRENG
jgi:hypothetical protein